MEGVLGREEHAGPQAYSSMESVQCGVRGNGKKGVCEERKEAEPDHIGPVGHGKKKLLFHSKQQELKKLPGTILSCLQTSEEPLYKTTLNLPTHKEWPQNIFLSALKQSPWNAKSLAPD